MSTHAFTLVAVHIKRKIVYTLSVQNEYACRYPHLSSPCIEAVRGIKGNLGWTCLNNSSMVSTDKCIRNAAWRRIETTDNKGTKSAYNKSLIFKYNWPLTPILVVCVRTKFSALEAKITYFHYMNYPIYGSCVGSFSQESTETPVDAVADSISDSVFLSLQSISDTQNCSTHKNFPRYLAPHLHIPHVILPIRSQQIMSESGEVALSPTYYEQRKT